MFLLCWTSHLPDALREWDIDRGFRVPHAVRESHEQIRVLTSSGMLDGGSVFHSQIGGDGLPDCMERLGSHLGNGCVAHKLGESTGWFPCLELNRSA